ncbi:hypothetical protein [Limimaricola pyoseonensis]|uniref:Uncharacterized protein n=1 Tax=Limimaricola pyoseonensis TaxID=521013 RepID=A0A1G7EC45_9RHOB|nr:hypothetical protein [Limimaricola pyoseonensis]SDE60975.1 hypothetical protein SAMN04488567_2090 [Limimaricola pyoseonensis]
MDHAYPTFSASVCDLLARLPVPPPPAAPLPRPGALRLARRLARLHAALDGGAFARLEAEARAIERLARSAGHAEMARLAARVTGGIAAADAAALAALVARLSRSGRAALAAPEAPRGRRI